MIRLCGIQYTFGAEVFYRERPVFLPKVQCIFKAYIVVCLTDEKKLSLKEARTAVKLDINCESSVIQSGM